MARAVQATVGDTELAVIPLPPHSEAILRVKPSKAALEAQYALCIGKATCAACDATFTILPGGGGVVDSCATFEAAKYSLANACEHSMGPNTFVVRCFIVSSGGVVSISYSET